MSSYKPYKRLTLEDFFLEFSKISDNTEKIQYLKENVRKFGSALKDEERKALSLFMLEQYYKIPEASYVHLMFSSVLVLDDFIERYLEIGRKEEKALFLKELVRRSFGIQKKDIERYLQFLVGEFFNLNNENQDWILDGICKNNRYYGLNFLLWLEDNGYEKSPLKENVVAFAHDTPGTTTPEHSKPDKSLFSLMRDFAIKYQNQSNIIYAALFLAVKKMPLMEGIEFIIDIFRSVDSDIGKKMSIHKLHMLFYGKNIESHSIEKQLMQFAPEIRELLDDEHSIYKNVSEDRIDGLINVVKVFLNKLDIDRVDFSEVGIDVLFDDTYESAKNVVNECNSKKHLPVLLKILESRDNGVRSVALEKFLELTESLDVKLLPQINNILDLLKDPDEFDYFLYSLDKEIKLNDNLIMNEIKGRSQWNIPKIQTVMNEFREWFNDLFTDYRSPSYFDDSEYPHEFDSAEEIAEKDYLNTIKWFFAMLEIYSLGDVPVKFENFLRLVGVYDENRKKSNYLPVDKEFLIFMIFVRFLGKKYEIPMT